MYRFNRSNSLSESPFCESYRSLKKKKMRNLTSYLTTSPLKSISDKTRRASIIFVVTFSVISKRI